MASVFVDTSAIVAILAGEPEARTFAALIESSNPCSTGAHVRLEATIAVARILGLTTADAHELYVSFLNAARIEVLPITDAVSRRAVDAFARFRKGQGDPARLNFGDCLSYACAEQHQLPILFKGDDFRHTDLKRAAT